MLRDGLKFKSKKKEMGRTIPKLRTHLGLRRTTSHAYYDHGQKSWDTGPTPPFTPQTMLDAHMKSFFRVSVLCRVG